MADQDSKQQQEEQWWIECQAVMAARNADCAVFNSASEKLAQRISYTRNQIFSLKRIYSSGEPLHEEDKKLHASIPRLEAELAELLKQAAVVELPEVLTKPSIDVSHYVTVMRARFGVANVAL